MIIYIYSKGKVRVRHLWEMKKKERKAETRRKGKVKEGGKIKGREM